MKPSKQKHRRVFDGLQNQQKKRDFTKANVGPISLLRVGIFLFVCLISGSLVGLGLFGVRTASATAGINQEISFEGKIVTSAGLNIPDGTYNMQFRIYTGCTNEPTNNTGCSAVWTEDYLNNNSQGVTFTSGTYQVNLGSICAFTTATCQNNSNTAVDWNSYPLYLSLQIGNTSNCSPNNPGASNFQADCGGDGEMNPYVLFTATPYAMNSNKLGGLTASQFGQLAANQTWTGTNAIQNSSTTGFQIQDSGNSANVMTIDTSGDVVDIGSNASLVHASQLYVKNTNSANRALILQGASGQSVDLLDMYNSSGSFVSGYDVNGNQFLNGYLQSGTTSAAGVIKLKDGTANSYNLSLTTQAQTSSYSITMPAAGATGSQCLQSSSGSTSTATTLQFGSCSGGSGIANQTTTQSANFNVQAATSGTVAGVLEANASGTGDILDLKNGSGANVATFGSTGAVLLQNSTNSTAAFQVQNAAADPVLNVSTVSSSLVSNSSFEKGTTNWSPSGSSTLSQATSSSNVYYGTGALAVALASSGTSGATTSTFTSALSAGTYSLSFMAKGSTSLAGLTASLGSGTCTLSSSTATTSYVWYYCNNVTTTGAPVITITSTTNSATLYIDAVELDAASAASVYRAGNAAVEGSLVVNGTQVQAAASAYAMTVYGPQNSQASSGGGLLIKSQTVNYALNDLEVQNPSGVDLLAVNSSTSNIGVNGGSSFWGVAALSVATSDAGAQALVVKGASSQSVDILQVKDNANNSLFSVGSAGATKVKTMTDSTAGFQVQDHSAHTLLTVDTSNQQTTAGQNSSSVITPTFNVVQSGTGDATMALQTASGSSTAFYIGNDVSNSNALTINSNYSATYAGAPSSIGYSSGTAVDGNGLMIQGSKFTASVTGAVTSMTVDFESWNNSGDKFSVAVYADGTCTGTPNYSCPGTLLGYSGLQAIALPNGSGNHNVNTINLTSTASVTSGTAYWLVFNTDSVSDGFWDAASGGPSSCWYSNTPIANGTWTNSPSSQGPASSGCTLNVTATITPSGSLTDTNTNALFTFSQSGQLALRNVTNSTTALQVQNASGYNVLGADTTDGWATLGASSHVNGALTVYNSTNANNVEILSGATSTSYTLALPTTGSSGAQCLQGTSGSTTTVTVLTFASCGGGSGINNQTTAQSANFYVQAATSGTVAGVLQANASGSGDILDLKNGSGTAVATFSSVGAALFENSTNSNTAFQIQNSTGNNVFAVGTSTSGLVSNSGFDVSASNWSQKGTATISQDTSAGTAFSGIGALKAQLSATSSGMQTSTFTTTIAATTQYQLTFYAKCDTSDTTFTYGRQDNGSDINGSTTATCNTNWQQYTWHYTTGGTISGPNIYVHSGSGMGSGHTIWLDAVSLVQTTTSAATNYQPGNLYLSGVIASPTTFQNAANSTLAFQIQNFSGGNELTVDTTNDRVIIGTGSTGESTAKLLVLDSGTSASDPTGVAGAMYYNSNLGVFRCYQGGLWQDCVGLDADSTRSSEFLNDDFFGNGTSAGTGPWTCAAIASGTFPAASVTVKHPGIDVATSSTSANSGFQCSTSTSLFSMSGGETFEMVFDPLTFTNTTVRIGLIASFTASLPSNGVFFTINSSGLMTAQAEKAGAISSGSNVTLSTGTWYRAKIFIDPSTGIAKYNVYDMSGTSLLSTTVAAANLPTVTLGSGFTATNSGTSATALDNIDYMGEWYTGVYAR